MKNLRWKALLGIALVAAVVWGLTLFSSQGQPEDGAAISTRPREEEQERLQRELKALQSNVQAVRREQAELAQTLEMRRNEAGPPSVVLDGGSKTDPVAASEPPPDSSEAIAQVTEQLEQRLGREARDSRWASQVETELVRSFSGDTFSGSRVSRVTCQSTLCRAEITHDSGDSQETFVDNLPFVLEGKTGFFRKSDDPGGEPKTLVFVAREGAPLVTEEDQ